MQKAVPLQPMSRLCLQLEITRTPSAVGLIKFTAEPLKKNPAAEFFIHTPFCTCEYVFCQVCVANKLKTIIIAQLCT